MIRPPFKPEMFRRRSGIAQDEKDLKKWLLDLGIEKRIEFIKELWPIHFRLALILVQSTQLPIKEVESLFRYWLVEGKHNTAQELIARLTPMLGEKKFWRIASQEDIPSAMRDFLNYHSGGRLDAELRSFVATAVLR